MNAAIASLVEKVDPTWGRVVARREVEAMGAAIGTSFTEVLSTVALEIAHRFDRHSLSHEDAMGKCAALYDAVAPEEQWPEALYEVYWALDEAEHGSDLDGTEENAAENRSRRCVKIVLAKFAADDA